MSTKTSSSRERPRHSGSKRRHPEYARQEANSSSSRRFVPDIDSGRSVKKTRSQFLCDPHPSISLPSMAPGHKLLHFELPRERLLRCQGSLELQFMLKEEAFVHPGLGVTNDPLNQDLYNAPSLVPAGTLDPADKDILPDSILLAGKDVDVAASARTKSFSWLRKGRFLTNDKYELLQANLSESDRQQMLLDEIRERARLEVDRSRSGVVARIKASFAAATKEPVNRYNPQLKAVAQWEILPVPSPLQQKEGTAICRFERPPQEINKDEHSIIGNYAPAIDQAMLLQSVLIRQPRGTFGFYAPCGENVKVDRAQQPQRLHWIREYASVPIPQPKSGHQFIIEIQPEEQLQAVPSDSVKQGVAHYTRLTERLSLHKRIQSTADDANRDIIQRPATVELRE